MENLARLRDGFLTSALADSTFKTYRAGVRAYLKFSSQLGVAPFPLTEHHLEFFVTQLGRQVTADTIRVYLSGIQFRSTILGYPQQIAQMCRLYYLVRGIKRVGVTSARVPREPIRSKHLKLLNRFVQSHFTSYDSTMYQAVIAVAFFGMLRVSEYTAPGRRVWDPLVTLSISDVVFRRRGGVKLIIKSSKTDPFKVGATVYLAATGLSFCPVSALKRYCRRRGKFPGPLFILENGLFLTKSDVGKLLFDCFPYNAGLQTHSFRIGGATAAAEAGVPSYLIQLMGRWRSAAFKKYIRFTSSYLQHISGGFATAFHAQLRLVSRHKGRW